MKMKTKSIVLALIAVSTMSGCSIYNAAKSAGQLMDYNTLSNDTIFNSQDGSQYMVAPHRNEDVAKIMVCYNNEGVFGSSAEEPLREVANEWIGENREGKVAGESKDRSGTWDAKVCYEFDVVEPQPIGAYLDEETNEVVVVGERTIK